MLIMRVSHRGIEGPGRLDVTGSQKKYTHPYRALALVLAAVLCLTAVTVAVSYLDLGAFKITAALTIAAAKATLVLLFFMGIGKTGKAIPITFITTIVILAVFIGLLFFDIAYR